MSNVQTNCSLADARADGRRLAILGFHKIGDAAPGGWETWFYIPEATFIAQLSYLRENDWRVLDLAAFLRALAEPEHLPRRAALLTFDDGYRSVLKVALPCLRHFEYPAVLFVPTDFIGGHNTFDAGAEPDEAICDWDELRELQQRGVSIQSHGVGHRAFSRLTAAEQAEELVKSREVLEARLGNSVAVFSYPYGDGGTDAVWARAALERAGYRAACLYGGGPNAWPAADPYRLTRLAMGPDTDLGAELEAG